MTLATSTGAAEIYKTIDSGGNVTYSQTPLVAGETEKLQQTTTPPTEAGIEASQYRKQQVSTYLEDLDQMRQAEAERLYKLQASRPSTYIQSNTWLLPTPVYNPWGRNRVGHYRGVRTSSGHSRLSSSILNGRSGLTPARDQWGRVPSYRPE